MTLALTRAAYLDLLSMARRHARRGMEAEDLLQETLVAALSAGKAPCAENRRWMGGVMRNIVRMNARGTARRRAREQRAFADAPLATEADTLAAYPVLDGLAPSLRIVALLALSGHNRAEIRHLLRISDEALRQRIAGLRRCRVLGQGGMPAEFPALRGGLAFGAIRRSLLPLNRSGLAAFASHDPDGHPLAFTILQPAAHKIRAGGN